MRVVPTVRFVAVLLVLLATAITGFVDAGESAGYASTQLQGLAVITQSIYSFLGLLGFFAVVLRVCWTVSVLALWAIAVTGAAGLAPVVWGGSGLGSGLAAAGGAGLFTALIVWAGWRAVASAGGAGIREDTKHADGSEPTAENESMP